MIAIGGSAPPRNGRQESATDVVWVLNSSAGEAINIHEAYPQKWEHGNPSSGGGDYPSMKITSNCNGIVYLTNVGNPTTIGEGLSTTNLSFIFQVHSPFVNIQSTSILTGQHGRLFTLLTT